MTAYAQPVLTEEPFRDDLDGTPDPKTLSAGWDISFGCRMNFGPDPDGQLRVSVHVSDAARRDGVARSECTPADLRLLAAYLLDVADRVDDGAGCWLGSVWVCPACGAER